tara:strand:+ start:699 stop:2414 length:1716 start_codon:yes stop_codon:yes gene_type:complete
MTINTYRRWTCVSTSENTKECVLLQSLDPGKGHLTKGGCLQACFSTDTSSNFIIDDSIGLRLNPGMGWSCNTLNGKCEEVSGGHFTSKDYCEKSDCHAINGSPESATHEAVPPVFGWMCDVNSGTCIKVLGGPYGTKEECSSLCSWSGGPTPPKYPDISYWRWFCSSKGCQYVRTYGRSEGFISYASCAESCSSDGKDDGVIVSNVSSIRNLRSGKSPGNDSHLNPRDKDGTNFFEDFSNPESLQTEIEQLVYSTSTLNIDFNFYEDLSDFFTTYNYPVAIVKKLDFFQYLKDSLKSKSINTLEISSTAFAAALGTYIRPVNNEDYLNLHIEDLHKAWARLSKHPSLIPKKPKDPILRDVKGNVITQGPADIIVVTSNLTDEPEMAKFEDLNPITKIPKTISNDEDVEVTKAGVELAFNKLPSLWRTGLQTIARTRPITSQPFIPSSFDNINGVVPYYGSKGLVSNRRIKGNLNDIKINLHQKIDFNVPEDHYGDRETVKYNVYSIDFRTDLNVSGNSFNSQRVNNPLYLTYGEKGILLSEGARVLNVMINPSNSIVMSVTRKAKPPTRVR